MNAVAQAALIALARVERAHARRWMSRIASHRPVKGEVGAAYAFRQAKRHLRKALAARVALTAIGGAS